MQPKAELLARGPSGPRAVRRERFVKAAMEFCRAEAEMRELKRRIRCTEMCAGEPEVGDPGIGPCCTNDMIPPDNYCEACATRVGPLKAARRVRANAKTRMLRHAARLQQGQANTELVVGSFRTEVAAQLEEAQRKEAERIANTVAWELRSYSDRGSHTLICRISGLIQRVCGIARDARNASNLGGDSREER